MIPVLLEAIIFIKENWDLWHIKDISESLRQVRENEKKKRTEKRMQTHVEEENQIAGDVASAGM